MKTPSTTPLPRIAALSVALLLPAIPGTASGLLGADVDVGLGGGSLADIDAKVDVGGGSLAGIDAGVELGGGKLADIDAKVDVGGGSLADIDANVNLGGGSLADIDADVNLGGDGGRYGSGYTGNGGYPDGWNSAERTAYNGMTGHERTAFSATRKLFLGATVMSSDRAVLGVVRDFAPRGGDRTLLRIQVAGRLGLDSRYARVVLDNPKVRDGRVWLGMSQKAFRRHMSDS